MERQGITKRQSAMLQGVAVLLMMYHHFFSNLTSYAEKLLFWYPDAVIRFAWFGKICVGIFSFVTGYGMCRVLEKSRRRGSDSFFKTLAGSYLACIRQAFKLLIRYWAILVVLVVYLCVSDRREFDGLEFLINFFCLDFTYNGSYWYVEQYVKMLLILPLLDVFFLIDSEENVASREKRDKIQGSFHKSKWIFYGILIMVSCLLFVIAWIKEPVKTELLAFIEWMRVAFILSFFGGYLLARFHVYEWLFNKLSGMALILREGLGVLLILAVGALRINVADSMEYATLDFLFVPVFVFGFVLLTEGVRCLPIFLGKIGEMSVYMWLTHLTVYDLTAPLILGFSRSHLVLYFLEVLLCLLVGCFCLWVDKAVKNLIS